MTCYRKGGGCGPYEMLPCGECPASKPEYAAQKHHKKTQTRADRIRAMTDEELAEWLDNNTYRFPIYKDWLDWLKQEVEE